MSFKLVPHYYKGRAIKTAKAISELDNVLLAAHVNLDGDALGSLGACGFILQKLGRKFAIYSSTGIPASLKFLTLPGKVYESLDSLDFAPQSAIYLDCGEPGRLGPELAPVWDKWPSVNIDHHLGGNGMGSLANFISPKAAATSQLVAYVVEASRLALAGPLADCIALGLMTDTGGFCHGNTTSDVFTICAELEANGCDIPALREKLQNNWPLDRLHLWGRLISEVSVKDDGKVALGIATLENLHKYHCGKDDLEGLVEWFRRIKGVKVAALLREENQELCKFSLRSQGDTDVRAMAATFGGGGHLNAAGGAINLPWREASEALLSAISEALKNHGGCP